MRTLTFAILALVYSFSANAQRTVDIDVQVTSPVRIAHDLDAQLTAHIAAHEAKQSWQQTTVKLQRKLYNVLYDHIKAAQGHTGGALTYPPGFSRHFRRDKVLTSEQLTAVVGAPPQPAPLPAGPSLRLTLTFTNRSNRPLVFNPAVASDAASIALNVTGPGAYHYTLQPRMTTMEIRPGRAMTLAPGASHQIELNSLRDGRRLLDGPWYLRKPGRYQLTVKYNMNGRTNNAEPVTGVSKPVAFEVVSTPE